MATSHLVKSELAAKNLNKNDIIVVQKYKQTCRFVPLMLSVKQEKAVNTNFKVIGVTRLGIQPVSAAPEANILTTRPPELLNINMIISINSFAEIMRFTISSNVI